MATTEPGFQQALRLMSQFGGTDVQAVQLYHKAMYNQMLRFIEQPQRSIITNLYMPHEIFYAMDLPVLFVEYMSGTLSAMRQTIELLDVAEQKLQTTGLCNYIVGLYGILENKHLPPPEFFIVPSEICEDAPKVFEYLRHKYHKQYYFLDIPFTEDEKSVDYVARQFEDLVAFLEKHTGEKLDSAKLSQAFKYSNQARQFGLKIRQIRKGPVPLMHGIGSIQLMGINALFGSEQAVEILKNLYEQLHQRMQSNCSLLSDNEHRIYWVHLFPPYATKMLGYLESNLKAAIVGDELFDVPKCELDETDPFRSLARKILNHPVQGAIENRVTNIVQQALEYKADGVVTFSPTGCRVGRFCAPNLEQALNKHNIPHLEITGDSIDFRNYSRSQMEMRLEAFIEIIYENKQLRTTHEQAVTG